MPAARVAFAGYNPVPIADYPFAPRPRHLDVRDLGTFDGGRLLGSISAQRVGATGSGELRLRMPQRGTVLDLAAVAPGTLRVSVGGRRVLIWNSWSWTGEGYAGFVVSPTSLRRLGLEVRVGEQFTVRVDASRYAAPGWRVRVLQPRAGG
jgi:hypothetical protein